VLNCYRAADWYIPGGVGGAGVDGGGGVTTIQKKWKQVKPTMENSLTFELCWEKIHTLNRTLDRILITGSNQTWPYHFFTAADHLNPGWEEWSSLGYFFMKKTVICQITCTIFILRWRVSVSVFANMRIKTKMEKYQYASRIPWNIMWYKNIKYVIAVNISFFYLQISSFFWSQVGWKWQPKLQRLCGRLQDSQAQTWGSLPRRYLTISKVRIDAVWYFP